MRDAFTADPEQSIPRSMRRLASGLVVSTQLSMERRWPTVSAN